MSSRQTIIKFLSGKYNDITNGIYSGSTILTEILDDGEQLNFKGCNANSFEVKISNLTDKAVIGEKISVCQKIENEEIQLFTGIIDSAEFEADKTYRKLIAYDELYSKSSINITEWYNNFFTGKSNVTLKTFRNVLFEHIGIEQVNTTLINDNMTVKNTAAGTIKFGDMVSNICELNGVFGNINRYGKFEYVSLDNKTAINITNNVRSNGKVFDYTVMPITRVELYTDKESNTYAAGSGNNFIVNGNSLLYGKTSSELKQIALNLLNKIKTISYIPVEISTIVSDLNLIPGTKVSFTTHSGKTITSFVMRNKLYDVQMFKQDITANGSETRSETVQNNNADLDVLQRAVVMKLDAYEAEMTYATITNLEAVKARVTSLEATEITTTYLESNYAKIDLANIKDGCITSAMIGTGVVGTAQIADGSITDAKIVGLTANKITAGVLDAGTIEVINLNAANITVGTINGQQIAPGAVDVDNIADYAITTEKIALGAVSANSIAAGCITGAHISTNTISAEKLAIGGDLTDFITVNELLPDSAIPTISRLSNRGSAVTGGYITKIRAEDDGILLSNTKPNCFRNGDKLYYKITVKADTISSVRVIIFFYKDKTYQVAVTSQYHTIDTTDTAIEGELTIGELPDVNNFHICLRDYTMQGQVYVKDASCRQQIGTTYITDGAITTDKIVANAITGDKIAAHTITANNILTGTITAASGIIADINADTITTGILKGITIQSTNYQEAVGTLNPLSGSKLNLADGSFKSKNLRWDSGGNVTCNNIKATSGTFTGTVNMKNGTIGEWAINSVGQMKSDRRFGTSTAGTDYRFFIQPIMSDSTTDTWMISSQYKAVQEEGYYAFWNIKLDGTATFGDVYANKYNTVSDRSKKHDIVALNEQTCINVICSQEPVAFKYNNTQYNRTQWGFIAQDVEEKLNALGITWQDFAVVDKTPRQKTDKDGNIQKQEETEYDYFLRYEAFIAPMIAVEKSHERRICELENQLAVEKALIQNLLQEQD